MTAAAAQTGSELAAAVLASPRAPRKLAEPPQRSGSSGGPPAARARKTNAGQERGASISFLPPAWLASKGCLGRSTCPSPARLGASGA